MSGRKKVKKKRIEPRVAKKSDGMTLEVPSQQVIEGLAARLVEAQECLKHYIKKDQIGDLANPAIELLTKWGITLG